MEAARVLAERGHKVTLCEKTDKLGGNLIPGGVPHFKRYDRVLVNWYKKQLELLNVKIELNREVKESDIASYKADEIIVATGSTPIVANFGCGKSVVSATDVLLGKVKAGKNVLIIGGGLVGCETGLWLAQNGSDVTIVEMTQDILGGPHGLPHMNHYMLEDLLNFHKVKIHTSTMVVSINDNKVAVQGTEGTYDIPADTIISAIGYKENKELYEKIKELDIPVYNIGDSQKVHNIMYAIWNAYEIAREL